MSVILFAWSAAKFPSSNVPERIIQDNIYITLELIRHDDVCYKLIFQKISYSINELWQLHAKPLLPQLASCGYSYLPILGHSVVALLAKWNFHEFILSHSSTTILTSMHLTSLNKMK